MLNTDQYSGTTTTSDRLIERDASGQYQDMFSLAKHAGAANYVAGRSCACHDRDGDGRYGICPRPPGAVQRHSRFPM